MTRRQHDRILARAARHFPRCAIFRDALAEGRRRVKYALPRILRAFGQSITQAVYDLLRLRHL
jgi:hypothetical protein